MIPRIHRLLAFVLLAILLLLNGPAPLDAQTGSQVFPQTGKTVTGRFLEYWRTHGALAQQGYPISNEFNEVSHTDGKIYKVQYFERAVFELHPENSAPNDVLLSLLGTFRYNEKYPQGAPAYQTYILTACTPKYDPNGPDRDCPDFANQAEAQCFYEAAGGPARDPHRLDRNNNGLACEDSLPPGPPSVPTPLPPNASTPIPPSQPSCVTFPETGKTVCGRFLNYWRQHGELAQQGYPISPEFTEVSDLNGQPYTVQYFQRAVFEYHPEFAFPNDVLLSQLGTFQFKAKYPNGESDGLISATPTAVANTADIFTYSNANLHISAVLPGKNWFVVPYNTETNEAGIKREGEAVETRPLRYYLAYLRFSGLFIPSLTMAEHANRTAAQAFGILAPAESQVVYLGYPASRIEGKFIDRSEPTQDEYHVIQMAFAVNNAIHLLVSGVFASEWDTGGHQAVEGILSSFALSSR